MLAAHTQPSDDPFWSRRGTTWETSPRIDPVVWGDRAGPLDAEQMRRYERDGFVVLPGLLAPDEVADVRERANALADDLAGADPEDGVILEPEGHAVRSVFEIHRRSDRLRRLASDERIVGAAAQILDSAVHLHQTRINFKPGYVGREFWWHSDFETWHIEDGMPRMRALSASILLSDVSAANGPLLLIPGSHRTYVRTVGETPPDHFKASLRQQTIGVPDPEALRALVEEAGEIRAATGSAGTVVLFDCNTMHGSPGNISPYPRDSAFVVYSSIHNRLVAPFGGRAPRPRFLADRDPEPLPLAGSHDRAR